MTTLIFIYLNREKNTFCVIKSLEHQQNLKTGRIPYLGLELTNDHACHQKPNPSLETVPFKNIFFKYLLVTLKTPENYGTLNIFIQQERGESAV